MERGAVEFESAWGPCTLAWSPAGVLELHLPDPADVLRRGRADPAPVPTGGPPVLAEPTALPVPRVARLTRAPAWVRRLARRIQGHLEGRLDDFRDVPLDLPASAPAFHRAVWEAARDVPPGVTITYGELAWEAGRPGAARAAGTAMRRCPIPLLIPAHRVIAAGRRPGGWTGAGGVPLKVRLLAHEGVVLPGWTPAGIARGGSGR